MRYFWDGGLLSNTPLREVINAHQDYWVNVKGAKNSVPNLEVYVINLHPSKQNYIPIDRDGVVSRDQDITFNDRTAHDVKVSQDNGRLYKYGKRINSRLQKIMAYK